MQPESITIKPLELDGVLLLMGVTYRDARGSFRELWNQERARRSGLDWAFVQDNFAYSHQRVLRGLHFQEPQPQGKLVTAVHGTIYDVAVDIRRDSSTFGKWVAATLSADQADALYIPPGFAHGYQVLSETALVVYKCTDYYRPNYEHTLAWNDPLLAIAWPLPEPIISAKDAAALSLKQILPSV
jgi:dTDP-4-dehydrorhamnose 3,5-epimerase